MALHRTGEVKRLELRLALEKDQNTLRANAQEALDRALPLLLAPVA